MGYTKIVQSGTVTEIYQYEKQYHQHRRTKQSSKISRRRRRELKATNPHSATIYRSTRNNRRAKADFYRLATTNLQRQETPVFITFTHYCQFDAYVVYGFLAQFWQRLKKLKIADNITYVSVPEWQPDSGFIHLHTLVWGLSKETVLQERSRRSLQRCYQRGYVDVRFAKNKSNKIASYLAKYLAKALEDTRTSGSRAYTSSRNVFKPRKAGGNSLANHIDLIIDSQDNLDFQKQYDTIHLGRCSYKKYSK